MVRRVKTSRAPVQWVDQAPEQSSRAPEKAWLRDVAAVGDVLFATADGPPPPERMAWLAAQIEDFMARMEPRSRFVFRASLFALSWVAPLLVFRFAPLRALSYETRARSLPRLERTPLAVTVFAVKAILCIVYYEHPDAAAGMGFDGRCLEETPGLCAESAP